MSFSSDVKAELAKNISGARHCRLAELAGIFAMAGRVVYRGDTPVGFVVSTEKNFVANVTASLVKRLFGVRLECVVSYSPKGMRTYRLVSNDVEATTKILQAIKHDKSGAISKLIIQQTCCKREFIKGMFMAAGSVSDPNKGYHFEIVCADESMAKCAANIMADLGITGRIVRRKKYYICYIKDGTMIVDMLNIMGAHISLMNMENVRILKDISNNINRRVNCETANINKIVNASVKQIDDINFIISEKGIGYLPEGLRAMAEVRLNEPEASLKELGEMMNPPIGKSGVNHRLKKISELADNLRLG